MDIPVLNVYIIFFAICAVIVGVFCAAGHFAFWQNRAEDAKLFRLLHQEGDSWWKSARRVITISLLFSVWLAVTYFFLQNLGLILKLLLAPIVASTSFYLSFWMLAALSRPADICRICGCFFAIMVLTIWWAGSDLAKDITANVIVLILATCLLSFFGKISTKAVFEILAALLLYDIVHVFWAGMMQEAVHIAREFFLPYALMVPVNFDFGGDGLFVGIGLADIIWPGFLVMISIREGKRLNFPFLLPSATIAGYLVGLVSSFVAALEFQFAQPAIMYLMLTVPAGLFGSAWYAGVLKEVWRGEQKI